MAHFVKLIGSLQLDGTGVSATKLQLRLHDENSLSLSLFPTDLFRTLQPAGENDVCKLQTWNNDDVIDRSIDRYPPSLKRDLNAPQLFPRFPSFLPFSQLLLA